MRPDCEFRKSQSTGFVTDSGHAWRLAGSTTVITQRINFEKQDNASRLVIPFDRNRAIPCTTQSHSVLGRLLHGHLDVRVALPRLLKKLIRVIVGHQPNLMERRELSESEENEGLKEALRKSLTKLATEGNNSKSSETRFQKFDQMRS